MKPYLIGAAVSYLAAVLALQSVDCRAGPAAVIHHAASSHSSRPHSLLEETIAETARNNSCAITVVKSKQTLSLYCNGQRQHTFQAEFGSNPDDKVKEGDLATPEGRYKIGWIKDPAVFYKALGFDYPNEQDWQEFNQRKEAGKLLPDDKIGGGIAIHGAGGVGRNWTLGCVALANQDMDILFKYVKQGKIIEGTTVAIVKER